MQEYKLGDYIEYKNGSKGLVVHVNTSGSFLTTVVDEKNESTGITKCHNFTGGVPVFEAKAYDVIGHWPKEKKPLECWVNVYGDGEIGTAFSADDVKLMSNSKSKSLRRFREVLE